MSEADSELVGKVAFSKGKIELTKEHVKAFSKMKVGSRVRLVIYGELTAKSEDKVDHEVDGAQHGEVEFNVKSMDVTGSNEFADLDED